MSKVAWPELVRFGLGELKLAPEVFWNLTPAELMILAGRDRARQPLNKSGLDALMQSFPDK